MTREVISFQLCGYCDASVSAYAAVIYLLIESDHGVHMRFVVAKTRVAPLKKQSIPRLELLSAVLLARLMDVMKSSLSSELKISSFHCFTDSRVALCWICNILRDRGSHLFKIGLQKSVACCNWSVGSIITGSENPADIPSRGATSLDLMINKLWRDGPLRCAVIEEQLDAVVASSK